MTDSNSLVLNPVTGGAGVEISGVDLSKSHTQDVYHTIQDALDRYGVVFFRNQNLTLEQYLAFAGRFGTTCRIGSARIPALADYPEIAEVRKEPGQTANVGGSWHTDQSFRPRPPLGTMLLAQAIPVVGGDTLFLNLARAYDDLSDGLKKTLEPLRAVHSNAKSGSLNPIPDTVHPVIVRHPNTGKKLLYVNPGFTTRFEGWTEKESAPLLDMLFQHAARPEYGCRFRWEVGSLAFWDNFQTWHYAVNDYHGDSRLLYRVVIESAHIDDYRGEDSPAMAANAS